MAVDVKLLDCTLRDGGYVNDWDFGHSVISSTYKRLDAAGVDYIEIGFLDDRRQFDNNRTIMPSTQAADRIFANVEKHNAIAVAMIDYGTCSIENIAPHSEGSFIDGIRVIFKKERIAEALPFCQAIKDLGYLLFIQAISVTAYSEGEMYEYVQQINRIHPYAFSIVDTYGLLDNNSLIKYFSIIDDNLMPDIALGYHDHNNFQLAFSNTIKILSLETKRQMIVDSTIYGMGKSAGNCPSELLAMHLNQYYSKNYNLDLILEIIDTDLLPIYYTHYWGYSYNFFISAMQRCHPNYVQYLLDKKTLSITSVNSILASIPNEKKLLYDKSWIEQAYIHYQSKIIDDSSDMAVLQRQGIQSQDILLLGPGKTIATHQDIVGKYILENKPLTFSAGFYTDKYKVDYVFLSNRNRYSLLADTIRPDTHCSKIIATSNITPIPGFTPYLTVNYESLVNTNLVNIDNTLMLLLSLLVKLGVKSVSLAGFDGFTDSGNDYCDRDYILHKASPSALNRSISNDLASLIHYIDLRFITPTHYSI